MSHLRGLALFCGLKKCCSWYIVIDMEDELIKKITVIAALSELSESHVLHFMILVRKFIGRKKITNFPALIFYSDWVVHEELDRKRAQDMLNKIDSFLFQNSFEHPFLQATQFLFSDFLSLEKLRIEIKDFLNYIGVLSALAREDKRWDKFYDNLLRIVSDCPLKFKKSSNNKIIAELAVGSMDLESGAIFAFNILMKDGQKKVLPILVKKFKSGILEEEPPKRGL